MCKQEIIKKLKELDKSLCLQEHGQAHKRLRVLLDKLILNQVPKPLIFDDDTVGTRFWVYSREDHDVEYIIRDVSENEGFSIPYLASRFIDDEVRDVNKVIGMLGPKYLLLMEMW